MKSFVLAAAMIAASASAQTPLWALSTTETRFAGDGSVGYTDFGAKPRKVDLVTEQPLGPDFVGALFPTPSDDGALVIVKTATVEAGIQRIYFVLANGATGVESWRRLVFEAPVGSGSPQPSAQFSHNGRYVMATRNADLAGTPGSLSTVWYRVTDGKMVRGVEGTLVPLSDGLHGIANGRFYRMYTGEEVAPLFSIPGGGSPVDARGGWLLGNTDTGQPAWAIRERDGFVRNIQLMDTEFVSGLANSARLSLVETTTRSIVLLNLETGARKKVVTEPSMLSAQVAPNGNGHIVSLGQTAKLFPLQGGASRSIFTRTLERVDFDSLGRPRTWHQNSRESRTEAGTEVAGSQEAVSVGTYPTGLRYSTDGELGVATVSGKVYRRVLKTGVETLWYTPLSNYTSLLASDNRSAVEYRRDGSTKELILVWHGPNGETNTFRGPVNSLAHMVMPDGRLLLSERIGDQTWLRFYDPKTGIMRRSYKLGSLRMNGAVSVSADAKRLLLSTSGGIVLVDLGTSSQRLTSAVRSDVSLSPDGKWYYESDRNFDQARIVVRRASDDAIVADLPGDTGRISPDGSRILTWLTGAGKYMYFPLPVTP
ncbi:hypothetical protein EON81_03655 [bacterium]|nr:MAG: hypothetical protein EON81_03655 [bacterium]